MYNNQQGCDSVVNLHLSIGGPNTGILTAAKCQDPYVSPSGNYSWASSGTYLDTLPNIYGCDSVITVNLTITPFPSTTVTFLDSVLTVSAVGVNYAWINCDNGNSTFPGANQQSFMINSNGSYAVIVSENGCADTSDCFVMANLEVDNLEKLSLKVFPNPTNGNVNIESSVEIIRYQIFDLNGKLLKDQEMNAKELTIDLSRVECGVYVLKCLTNSNYESTYRLMKTK